MGHHDPSQVTCGDYRLLEASLEEILSVIKPAGEDRLRRENVINELALLIRQVESLKGAFVNPFGSFVSNIYSKWGDLDISIELSSTSGGMESIGRNRKRNMLCDIMNVLRKTGNGRCFQFIPQARVPLLKFQSNDKNISCDISINNPGGPLKSKFLLWITEMDSRFRDLVLLIKEWAKAHGINNPKLGTLNSYSLCLLVIFHLQTCEPAILPPLKDLVGFTNLCDNTGRAVINERDMKDFYTSSMTTFRTMNKSSLSDLFISFFEKFREIATRSTHYAICTFTGRWEEVSSKNNWLEKSYSLIIEDPFDQPDNAARAVRPRELIIISDAVSSTHANLKSAVVLSKRASLLNCLARPVISESMQSKRRNGMQQCGMVSARSGFDAGIGMASGPKVGQRSSSSNSQVGMKQQSPSPSFQVGMILQPNKNQRPPSSDSRGGTSPPLSASQQLHLPNAQVGMKQQSPSLTFQVGMILQPNKNQRLPSSYSRGGTAPPLSASQQLHLPNAQVGMKQQSPSPSFQVGMILQPNKNQRPPPSDSRGGTAPPLSASQQLHLPNAQVGMKQQSPSLTFQVGMILQPNKNQRPPPSDSRGGTAPPLSASQQLHLPNAQVGMKQQSPSPSFQVGMILQPNKNQRPPSSDSRGGTAPPPRTSQQLHLPNAQVGMKQQSPSPSFQVGMILQPNKNQRPPPSDSRGGTAPPLSASQQLPSPNAQVGKGSQLNAGRQLPILKSRRQQGTVNVHSRSVWMPKNSPS